MLYDFWSLAYRAQKEFQIIKFDFFKPHSTLVGRYRADYKVITTKKFNTQLTKYRHKGNDYYIIRSYNRKFNCRVIKQIDDNYYIIKNPSSLFKHYFKSSRAPLFIFIDSEILCDQSFFSNINLK